MTNRVQVSCISKTNRTDVHDRIQNIGGVNADGSRWRLSETNAIAGIISGRWEFYVSVRGHTVKVIVANSAAGREYLKTEADSYQPDNLLALPECT